MMSHCNMHLRNRLVERFAVVWCLCFFFLADVTKSAEAADQDFVHAAKLRFELVAGEDLIRWPIAAVRDRDDSLIVLECHWNRESVQQQLQSKPHQVVRLRDTDADGRFDSRSVIAKDLSFPEGVMLFDDHSLLVSTPPVITKLTDEDGDGFFEQHRVWYDGGTLTHCANDLHGPVRGPDGWIYWTKGAFASQTVELLTGATTTSTAAHMYRRHPSGGPVDRIMTGGMDNPVDIAFLPDGERFFCSTFMHHPGDGIRDGVGHSIYGAVFGKAHQVLDGHVRTGPLMNPVIELGPAAPAGLATLASRSLVSAVGQDPADETSHFMVTAQFNLHKIGLHRLRPRGASFEAESFDLVSSPRIDFHPIDVIEDADGSLLIVDTGGWYDLCCPSSGTKGQVAPGGLYRLSVDSPPTSSPASVVTRATVPRDIESQVQWFRTAPGNDAGRLTAFWALVQHLVQQPEHPGIRKVVMESLSDDDAVLRRAAAHVVSLYRIQDAQPILLLRLPTAQGADRRLVVECLGRLSGEDEQVTATLMKTAINAEGDRALHHAALYALIERNKPELLRSYLGSDQSLERFQSLWVLNETGQIRDDDLTFLLTQLRSHDAELSELAGRILGQRTEFAPRAIQTLERWWRERDAGSLTTLSQLVVRWYREAMVTQQVGTWLAQTQHTPAQRAALIAILRGVQGASLPSEWIEPIEIWIGRSEVDAAVTIAEAMAHVKWSLPRDIRIIRSLVTKANDGNIPWDQRLAFIHALPPSTEGVDTHTCNALITGIVSQQTSQAQPCTTALPHVRLPLVSAQTLVQHLEHVSPLHLETVVVALLNTGDETLERSLATVFEKLPAAKSVSRDRILNALKHRPGEVQSQWQKMFERLQEPPRDIVQAVEDWLAKLPAGDPVRGHQVFSSTQAGCVQCHRVGYLGGRVGPELTQIGRSRTRRDLLEAILFPSARLEQSYQATRVLTHDGRVFNGLVANRTAATLELICGADQRCFVALDEIESQEPSEVSIMPAGLEQSITPEQLADLIAFLEKAR